MPDSSGSIYRPLLQNPGNLRFFSGLVCRWFALETFAIKRLPHEIKML
jgi:hypothetical protein